MFSLLGFKFLLCTFAYCEVYLNFYKTELSKAKKCETKLQKVKKTPKD